MPRLKHVPNSACCRISCGVILVAAEAWSGCLAAGEQTATAGSVPEVVVVGTTPVPGLNLDANKVPSNIQSLLTSDLARNGSPDLLGSLNGQLGSVNINEALADPFQPDISYRGFSASPVLGTPQGLAVYQNGVRVNEAFGDSVNWDVIPDLAIRRVDLVSSSPLFGLNALGGAVSVTMKNGFTNSGGSAAVSGGAFNQRSISADVGFNRGILGAYAAVHMLEQDGWRLFARDALQQYYLDLSLHGDGPTLDLSYSRANNRLGGPGAAPVQSLAINANQVFTGPQSNINDVDFITLNSAYEFTPSLAVQNVLYHRSYVQAVSNGNKSADIACVGLAALCQSDGMTPLTASDGALIPDISHGGQTFIGQNDSEFIHSSSWGGSLQLTRSARLADHGNSFAAGATLDTAHTRFASRSQLGIINSSLIVVPSPYAIYTPEGTDFSATPVLLDSNNKYYGLYGTDTLDLTSAFTVTLSGRYNVAKIDLTDQGGSALNGRNRFTHVNFAAGGTYTLSAALTLYASYSTNNRAPTPSEIECSDPLRPCLLPNSLAGDPPSLRQVIAHTEEFGARGKLATSPRSTLVWNASVFRTRLDDDIYGIATTVSTGFFQNIGATRRQGVETGLTLQSAAWQLYGNLSVVDATFQSPLLLRSASNPRQDAAGNIHVLPGDRLPLIPRMRMKFGADYAPLPAWSAGASLVVVGGSFYKGDESNQNPQLPGYTVVNLRSSWVIAPKIELFVNVQNVFDRYYATYGLYTDPTGVNAPGVPADSSSNAPGVDNRFQSPSMPRAFFGGIKLRY